MRSSPQNPSRQTPTPKPPAEGPDAPALAVRLTDAAEPDPDALAPVDPHAAPIALRPQDAERLAELWERTTPPSTRRARDGACSKVNSLSAGRHCPTMTYKIFRTF